MKVVIVGGGQVGAYIAKLLLKINCVVKVIENRESVFEKLKTELPTNTIIFGNGTEPNILEFAGISNADVLAAVTGADEANLVASTISKFEFNVPRIIARVNNPKNAWLFNESMGVDVALNQADLLAHLVVEEADLKNILMLMKINHGTYSIVQSKVQSESEAVNRSVNDLSVSAKVVLIALYRGDEVIIPNGDTVICEDDSVLFFANEEDQAKLNDLFSSRR